MDHRPPFLTASYRPDQTIPRGIAAAAPSEHRAASTPWAWPGTRRGVAWSSAVEWQGGGRVRRMGLINRPPQRVRQGVAWRGVAWLGSSVRRVLTSRTEHCCHAPPRPATTQPGLRLGSSAGRGVSWRSGHRGLVFLERAQQDTQRQSYDAVDTLLFRLAEQTGGIVL